MGILDILVIALYLLGMLLIGFYSKGKMQTMDDFILGGKRFNKFALVGTIVATMIGSGMTMGAVGDAYSNGAAGTVFWMYFGFGLGLFFFAYLVKPIRATGKRTMSEILSDTFGKGGRVVSAIIIIFYGVALIAINIAGLRNVIVYAFGDVITSSLTVATIIATLVCIAFTSMGGFYAVVWTDTVQLMIMILGIFIIGPIIGLMEVGSPEVIVSTYEAEGLSITNPLINGISSSSIGFFLAYFLTVPGDPTMPQRALAGRETKATQIAYCIAGVIGFGFGFVLMLTGGITHVLIPGLENSEAALPMFIAQYFPPVIKGLCISALIAAVMSSFSSFLILSSTHLTYDLGTSFNKELSEEKIHKMMPWITIIIGLIGLVIALYITSLFDYLYMVFSIIASSLMPAFMGALFWREKMSKTAGILSLITGALVPAVLYLTKGYDVFLGDPVFLGIISSTAVLIIFSLILKDRPEPKAEI